MTQRNKFTKEEITAINSVQMAVIVTGPDVVEIFRKGGAVGLAGGYLGIPRRCKAEVRVFPNEDSLEGFVSRYSRHVESMSSCDKVKVLRGRDALEFTGFCEKARLFSERCNVDDKGAVHFNGNRTRFTMPIRNSNLFLIPERFEETASVSPVVHPWDLETRDVIFTSKDILEKVSNREHLYFHTAISKGVKYVLDFSTLLYWPLRGLPPGIYERQLPYMKFNKISRECVGYLMSNEGLNADLMLNCEMGWQNDLEIIEVCRQEIDGCGEVRRRYNFIHPRTGFLSRMWFDGTSEEQFGKELERFAYIITNNGRQWFRVTFSGKVEKWRFEQDNGN